MLYEQITDIIGNTPLLRLGNMFPDRKVYAKCEFMNPISIKDRPVLNIIKQAEKIGALSPGDTIIEATSGNTGMALSYIACVRGYKVIIVMSEIQSVERRKIMKAFGAKLILTPRSEGTKGAKSKLKEILEEHPEYFYLGQHINPSNPEIHYQTTGPEIWRDTDGNVDILTAGLGTGGTLCGAGRYLKEQKPSVQTVAIEPSKAPFISQGKFSPHLIMGTAPGFYPKTVDKGLIDSYELVSEEEAFSGCRELAVKEGLLTGISSGANAAVMKRIMARPENKNKTAICIFADTGQRYLSVNGLFD